jgi:hypothetical protein
MPKTRVALPYSRIKSTTPMELYINKTTLEDDVEII